MEQDPFILLTEAKPKPQTVKAFLRQLLFVNKLGSAGGLIILLLASLAFAFVTVYIGAAQGILLLIVLMAIPVVYSIVAYPEFGIMVLLIMAYFLFFIMRQGINFPLGTLMDGIQALLILGFFIKQKTRPDWKSLKGPISTMILVWIGYNLLEIANPVAESRLAWVYTVRSVAIVMLMYFVFTYHIRSVKFIRLIFKVWIALTFIGAAYAFKQEYFGFSASEEAWLHSDPNIASLFFIDGHWRKFSIFSDPVSFSYNMVVSSLLCIALMSSAGMLPWKKIVLGLLTLFFLIVMLYSGTRGAYVLVPAALILFSVLNYNKKVMKYIVIAAVFIGFLIVVPTSNPSIYRFQTAFRPSNDASFNVRKANQKRIQPYILTHPMGGGLGATGAWGQRFAPQSYLANFPPDSGYVRVAVELGWIGLLLFCILMFVILRTGISHYYQIKNPELKTYCLAMVLIVFAFNIGNYPQEALVQFPSNVYFYLTIALINVIYRLDKEWQKNQVLPL